MRQMLTIFFIFFSPVKFAQSWQDAQTDQRVQSLDAPTLDSLSALLVKPAGTEREKVRAIYSWIASHIAYNTAIIRPQQGRSATPKRVFVDTALNWSSGVSMTAQKVFDQRMAVCDGYAKLFQVLCEKAGLTNIIINGYAKGYNDSELRFRTNHSWNAVFIDSSWQLVDVTWGSGYVTYGNQFIQKTEEKYFLSDPAVFAQDHFPEDTRWLLGAAQSGFPEFARAPFRFKNFVKYGIEQVFPAKGQLSVAPYDTLVFVLRIKNREKDRVIAPDAFTDSADLTTTRLTCFLQPVKETGTTVEYRFAAGSEADYWVNLVYNGDAVLRYRVRVSQAGTTGIQ